MHIINHDRFMDSCMSKVPSFRPWIGRESEILREIIDRSGFSPYETA